jgi:hypothetical protein
MNARETMDFEWYSVLQVCAALESKKNQFSKQILRLPMASPRNRWLIRLRHWLSKTGM